MFKDLQAYVMSRIRKISLPRITFSYVAVSLLSFGATLTDGFLSFCGMYLLWPVLPFLIVSFLLSVSYEGEIYVQNIRASWDKLFKPGYLRRLFSNDFLLRTFPDVGVLNCPAFFDDYLKQLALLEPFEEGNFDEDSSAEKEALEATLEHMQACYERQLFGIGEAQRDYERSLRDWLSGCDVEWVSSVDNPFIPLNIYMDGHFEDRANAYVYKAGTNHESASLYYIHANLRREKMPLSEEVLAFIQSKNTTPFGFVSQGSRGRRKAPPPTILSDDHPLPRPSYKNTYLCDGDHLVLINDQGNKEIKTLTDSQKQELQTYRQRYPQKVHERLTSEEIANFDAIFQSERDRQKAFFEKRVASYRWVFAFSFVVSVLMAVGMTYLLVDAFAMLPFLAAVPTLWPAIIVPLVIIAGIAYGGRTYNAITDIIAHDTFGKWYQRIKSDLDKGLTVESVGMAFAAVALFVLAIALTVCTAGTWWTILQDTHPLFKGFKRIPVLALQILIACLIGSATFLFNSENTFETLQFIYDHGKKFVAAILDLPVRFIAGCARVWANETWLQRLNPFRIFLTLVVKPLRIVMFLGHVISIGVNSDRLPNVPEIFSILLGIISEFFEDLHYFVKEEHEKHGLDRASLLKEQASGGHNHDDDIPSRLLFWIFGYVYEAAMVWDYYAGPRQPDETAEAKQQAWDAIQKKYGFEPTISRSVPATALRPSAAWKTQQQVQMIDEEVERLQQSWIQREVCQQKTDAFATYKQVLLSASSPSLDDGGNVFHLSREDETTTPLVSTPPDRNQFMSHRYPAFFSPEEPASLKAFDRIEAYAEVPSNDSPFRDTAGGCCGG